MSMRGRAMLPSARVSEECAWEGGVCLRGIFIVWKAKGALVSLLRSVKGGETTRSFRASWMPSAAKMLRVRCQTVIPAPISVNAGPASYMLTVRDSSEAKRFSTRAKQRPLMPPPLLGTVRGKAH